jgi:hypothetical protein
MTMRKISWEGINRKYIFFCIDTYDGSKKFQNEPLK